MIRVLVCQRCGATSTDRNGQPLGAWWSAASCRRGLQGVHTAAEMHEAIEYVPAAAPAPPVTANEVVTGQRARPPAATYVQTGVELPPL